MGNGPAGRPHGPVGKRSPPAKGEQPGGEIRLDRLSGGADRRPPVCCPWRILDGIGASLIYGDTATEQASLLRYIKREQELGFLRAPFLAHSSLLFALATPLPDTVNSTYSINAVA